MEKYEEEIGLSKKYIIMRIRAAISKKATSVNIYTDKMYSHDEIIEFMQNFCAIKGYKVKTYGTYYHIILINNFTYKQLKIEKKYVLPPRNH